MFTQNMATSSNIDPGIKDDEDPIPLHCFVCPKQPNFSDVSHLLTHICSKSHLSHIFKLRIRAPHEGGEEAQEALELYDEWYCQYGIADLLATRMAVKDLKRANKRGRPSLPKVEFARCRWRRASPNKGSIGQGSGGHEG